MDILIFSDFINEKRKNILESECNVITKNATVKKNSIIKSDGLVQLELSVITNVSVKRFIGLNIAEIPQTFRPRIDYVNIMPVMSSDNKTQMVKLYIKNNGEIEILPLTSAFTTDGFQVCINAVYFV